MVFHSIASRAAVFTAAAAALALPVVGASPAGAATYSAWNNCAMYPVQCDDEYGPGSGMMLFYHSTSDSYSYPSGSFAYFYGDVYNYAGDTVSGNTYHYIFKSGLGDGSGQAVKNNAASAQNCNDDGTLNDYRIYYNSGYAGHSQIFGHGYWCDAPIINLDSTLKNENASQHFA